MLSTSAIARSSAPEGHESTRIPVVGDDGLVRVDPWWGTVQPQQLHPEIPTWGELEVIAQIESGGRLIDTRLPEYIEASGTIPTAIAVPWEMITDHLDLFDPEAVTALFCNGPQCAATPRAIDRLLKAGLPPKALAYYRGGLQDWVSLGFPTVPAAATDRCPIRLQA